MAETGLGKGQHVVLSSCTQEAKRCRAQKSEFGSFERISPESATPVAITRHGTTIGFYVPAPRKRSEADLEALRAAGEQLDALIAAAGTSEDELVQDFKKARTLRRKTKG